MTLYKSWTWKGNHGSEQPCRMICYDTETFIRHGDTPKGVESHSLRLGVASLWKRDNRGWRRDRVCLFRTCQQFWQFVYSSCKSREPLWVYAHNAAYDFTIVRGWNELATGKIRLTSPGRTYRKAGQFEDTIAKPWRGTVSIDGLPWIVEARCDRGTLRFCDTLNYLPVSLAKLGTWVGLPKLTMPTESASESDWFFYCQRDVEILERTLLQLMTFWHDRKLGTWQTTIGRLSFSAFRHANPCNGITAHGDSPYDPDRRVTENWRAVSTQLDAAEVSAVERRAYYGGRTAVYYCGDIGPTPALHLFTDSPAPRKDRPRLPGPCAIYDVNGLYPCVMSEHSHPVRLVNSIRNPILGDAKRYSENLSCVADVLIETTEREYPIRLKGRVYYARGRYATSLAGEELRRAFAAGDVLKCSNLCLYQSGRPFTEFVRYWDAIKTSARGSGDDITELLAKLMQNALFGKLGQRSPTWELDPDTTPLRSWGPFIKYDPDTRRFTKYRSIGRTVQRQGERHDCGHTMTAAAASITAAARCYMDDIRKACPANTVLYQDTDSLFLLPAAVSSILSLGLIDPLELGRLKHVGDYAEVGIYAPKVYHTDSVLTAGGLPAKREPLGTGRYRYTAFERAGSIIAREPDGTVKAQQRIYTFADRACELAVGPDGWCSPVLLCNTFGDGLELLDSATL